MESFGVLYARYFPKVFQTCLAYSGNHDDAFDLAHDIILKAFNKIDSFKGNSSFSTWLFSITRNHCVSYLSRRKRAVHEDVKLVFNQLSEDTDREEFEERLYKEKIIGELGKFLNQLPDSDQRMLELKYAGKYSVKDLQKEFGLSSSAVKMRLLRSRQKVEKVIKGLPVHDSGQLQYA